jgi:hypothetical protein
MQRILVVFLFVWILFPSVSLRNDTTANPIVFAEARTEGGILSGFNNAAEDGISSLFGVDINKFSADVSSKANSWLTSWLNAILGAIMGGFVYLAASVMHLMGWIFDNVLDIFGANFGTYLNSSKYGGSIMEVIFHIWSVFRDFGNIVLIGVFVFIACRVILGVGGHSNKQLVINIIICALLINFSLFFVKAAIDVSNFFAYQFYRSMTHISVTENGTTTAQDVGVATRFATSMGVQKMFGSNILESASFINAVGNVGGQSSVNSTGGILLDGILKVVLFLGIAYVFALGTFLLVGRGVTLVILMVVSSLAFIMFVVPSASLRKYFDQWKDSLLQNALFAPLLMLLLWASVLITDALVGVGNTNKPDPFSFISFVNYALTLGFLYAAITIAKKVADQANGQILGGAIGKGVGALGGFAVGLPFRAAILGREGAKQRALTNVTGAENKLRGLVSTGGSDEDIAKAQKKLEAAKKRLEQKGDFRADSELAKRLQKMGVNMGSAASKSLKDDIEKAKKEKKAIDDMRADATGDNERKAAAEDRRAPLAASEKNVAQASDEASQANAALVDRINKERVDPADATSKTGEQLRGAIDSLTSQMKEHTASQASMRTELTTAEKNNDITKASVLKNAINAKSAEIQTLRDDIAKHTAELQPLVDRVTTSAEATPLLKQIRDTMDKVATVSNEHLQIKKADKEYELRQAELRKIGQDAQTVNIRQHLSKVADLGKDPARLEAAVSRALKRPDQRTKEDRQASEDAYRASRTSRVSEPTAPTTPPSGSSGGGGKPTPPSGGH